MRKIIFIIFISFIWNSCRTVTNKTNHYTNLDSAVSIVESRFDIDYIKSKTKPLSSILYIDNLPNNKQSFIPSDFLSQYIFPHSISIGGFKYSMSEYTDAYAFKEYKEFENFDLFTFTFDHQENVRVLYGVTTKKDRLEVINTGLIGFDGEEYNGWLGEKSGMWLNDSIFKAIEISDYDDDFVEANNNSQIDTIWSLIHLNSQGYFSETITQKVKYLEGRKISD